PSSSHLLGHGSVARPRLFDWSPESTEKAVSRRRNQLRLDRIRRRQSFRFALPHQTLGQTSHTPHEWTEPELSRGGRLLEDGPSGPGVPRDVGHNLYTECFGYLGIAVGAIADYHELHPLQIRG